MINAGLDLKILFKPGYKAVFECIKVNIRFMVLVNNILGDLAYDRLIFVRVAFT